MRRRVIFIAAAIVLLLIIPGVMVSAGLILQNPYSETYYGELPAMYDRLAGTEGKKVVLIGNSGVAFGVRSDLLEKELDGYKVVNFGLYGAIGTKTMLDLSEELINEGDIVIIIPELYEQTASLYFSSKDVYRAVAGRADMIRKLIGKNREAMVAGYIPSVAERYSYQGASEKEPNVYFRASFLDPSGKEAGYMTYERPYNIMLGGYDPVNLPMIDPCVYGAGFIDYLNEYAKAMQEKGAKVLYGFTGMNELATDIRTPEKADALFDYLREKRCFDIMSNPVKYVLDYRWFYDNNVHLNSAGAYKYTALLAEDIKMYLGMDTRCDIEVPQIPEIPVPTVYAGDNRDAGCFLWDKYADASGDYIMLTGLTEEGKTAAELIIPSDYDGVPVRSFSADVFAGNSTVSRLILSPNVTTIYDYSFDGAERLTELIFMHDNVLRLKIGYHFLDGADNCYIYVKPNVSLSDCAGGWERYQSRVRVIESK